MHGDAQIESAKIFKNTLDINSNHANSYNGFGWVYYHLDNLQKVKKYFQKLLN